MLMPRLESTTSTACSSRVHGIVHGKLGMGFKSSWMHAGKMGKCLAVACSHVSAGHLAAVRVDCHRLAQHWLTPDRLPKGAAAFWRLCKACRTLPVMSDGDRNS
jgi:hypothetical protein